MLNQRRKSGGKLRRANDRTIVRSFQKTFDLCESAKSLAHRFFPAFLTVFLLLLAACGVASVGFYNYYASIVDQRIRSGFWHSRGGIYAAPYTLAVGGRATRESIVDRLKRAGFVEGANPDPIWNGGYILEGGKIAIFANAALTNGAAETEIDFSKNRISAIKQDRAAVTEFSIEPEMLVGHTETKRTGAHVLTFAEIPEALKNAIISAEDQRFFEHYGVDPFGIARAFVTNLTQGEIKQGGSTITQQLVKNTFLSPEKSFQRKFAEAFLSIALERRMSKEQIFALYCNEIYLGQYGSSGVHGVEQAAHTYFGKDLNSLSLAEAAAIAAMIKNPNRYAPNRNIDAARTRRELILKEMGEAGFARSEEIAAAINTDLRLVPPKFTGNTVAPYFVDAATRELDSKFEGDYLNTNFNIRVYTTIDTSIQNLAENAVRNGLSKLDKTYQKKGLKLQASLVAMNPRNGQVLALVGGRDYTESQFNRATDAYRQPGSTFKPFVYATAFERGFTPMSLFSDAPTEFIQPNTKPYEPANYGHSYSLTHITLKTALAKSSNVVAVKTAMEAGLGSVAEMAGEFGFRNIEPYPSIALGTMEVTPLQLAAAYAAFANGGKKVEPTFIDRIVSGEDRVLYLANPDEKQIVSEKTAYMITDMLEAVVERGTARAARSALGDDVAFAGKTGSSKDGWFVGYTPNLVTVVWIGVDENEDIGATGGQIALPIWVDFMKAVVQSRPEYGGEEFAMPKGLTTAVIDPATGMLAGPYCPTSEKVVVPTSAVSNVECLTHRPRQAPLTMAVLDPAATADTIITIPATGVTDSPDQKIERPYIDEYDETEDQQPKEIPSRKPRGREEKLNDGYYREFQIVTGKPSGGE